MSLLSELHTFHAVAAFGGFSKAAEQLEVSKGLVSRHIKTLEDHFQTRLFHRTTRKVSLTEAGQKLYDKARQIELLAREAQSEVLDVAQEVGGDLKVTMPDELGREIAREVIPEFIAQNPHVVMHLNFDLSFKDVEMGEVDVALRAVDKVPDNVIAKQLGLMKNLLLASPEYLARFGVPDAPAALTGHKVILSSHKKDWNRWELTDGESVQRIALSGQIYAGVYSVAANLAISGLGITSVPIYQALPLIRSGELVQVLPDWYQAIHRVNLLYAAQRAIPKKIARFNQAILSWAKAHPDYFV